MVSLPARQLLQDIYNRPAVKGPCWYHNRHGIATNLNNCPGPSFCSWNQEEEVKKMQDLINKCQKKNPAQRRLAASRVDNSSQSNHVSVSPPTVPVQPISIPPTASWSDLMDKENQQPFANPPVVPHSLEDLLMSESE